MGLMNENNLGYLGHMTKIATTPIYSKNCSEIFCYETKGQMIMWFGMDYCGFGSFIVFSNDYHRLAWPI